MTSVMILLCVVFDRRLAQRAAEEERRLKSFADAAVEGLIIIEAGLVKDANASFEALTGYSVADIASRDLSELIHTPEGGTLTEVEVDRPVEVDLVTKSGAVVPVEIVGR